MTRIDMDGQRPIMKGFTKEKERQLVFKEYFGITLSVSDLERIRHRDTRLFSPDPCRLQFSQQRSTVARGHYLDGFVRSISTLYCLKMTIAALSTALVD
jgi:hypothetical protein